MNKIILIMALGIIAATGLVISVSAPAHAVSQSNSQGLAQGGNSQEGLVNIGNVGYQFAMNTQCVAFCEN